MLEKDRKRIAGVLEAHTKRVALDELASHGKSHVRVISGESALELIAAVVDETIARRATELSDLDRDDVVQQANKQFQHVARLQADAEGLIGRLQAAMEQLVERIGKTLSTTTTCPVDRPVEATDVLVSKIFDHEDDMESNLPRLPVEVTPTRDGIKNSLARLRELRDLRSGQDNWERPRPG